MMKRILVIDDSPVIRNFLKDFLLEDGYEVQVTDDPVAGTKLALDEEWSLIICDTHIPGKSGYDVYTDINTKKPDLPFLITDSLPEDLSLQDDFTNGNYYYIKKPFEIEQIRQIVKSCFKAVKIKQ